MESPNLRLLWKKAMQFTGSNKATNEGNKPYTNSKIAGKIAKCSSCQAFANTCYGENTHKCRGSPP